MSKLHPEHEPKPVRLQFTFQIAADWRERHVVEHGTRPAEKYTLAVELTELDSPALRRRWLDAHRGYDASPFFPELQRPTDDRDEVLEALEAWLVGQERRPFEEVMEGWIADHGSPRLRTAHERGYKVNATYARERAKAEFPLYWVDTNKSAGWRERTDPSLEALALETGAEDEIAATEHDLEPTIVWLTTPPDDLVQSLNRAGANFAAGEAVRIGGYLGRYALYLPLAHPREEA